MEKASAIFDPRWYAEADECLRVHAGVAYARESASRGPHQRVLNNSVDR